ncbi:MAG: EamA family transporter [Planctomycetota bacterium]
MNWITLSLFSACFLGLYELAKKASLRENAVPPVLFLNVLTGALLWGLMLVIMRLAPAWIPFERLKTDTLTLHQHGLLFLKSVLAGSSWIFASFAMKHLPMSIATPIRATSPLWTISVAVVFMGERPTAVQWIGVIIILGSFYMFSLVGRKEGIKFHRDRWVGCMMIATLLGAFSALYDKWLLQRMKFSPSTVQAWFAIYLLIVMTPLVLHWYIRQRATNRFQWRWSIPMIAVLLLVSDFQYFSAISCPGASISLISPLRRTSVIISFIAAIRIYHEQNWQDKAIWISGMVIGICVLSASK